MKKVGVGVVAVIFAIGLLVACGGAGHDLRVSNPVPVTIRCGSGSGGVVLDVGQALTCNATDSNRNPVAVSWASNNPPVATVDQFGAITGHEAGTATITATPTSGSGNAAATIVVTVENPPPPPPPTINLFAANPQTIVQGGQSTLTLNVSGATTIAISDGINNTVVTGTSYVVEPVATTTYTLTASNAGGETQATTTVTVTAPTKTVVSVGVVLGEPSIEATTSTACVTTVTYSDKSTDNDATCSSGNLSVATVANNIVTGVAAGMVTITATSNVDITKSASTSLTVTAQPAIDVVVSPTYAVVAPNGQQQFRVLVWYDSQNRGVYWTLTGSGCAGAGCGTISDSWSASGTATIYTAPATPPTGHVYLTAVSVTDSTKSMTATIDVQAPSTTPVTNSVTPSAFFRPSGLPQSSPGFYFHGQNYADGLSIVSTRFPATLGMALGPDTQPTQFGMDVTQADPYAYAAFDPFVVGGGNAYSISFLGNRSTGDRSANEEFILNEPLATVSVFDVATASYSRSFAVPSGSMSIAVDSNSTGDADWILLGSMDGIVVVDPNGNIIDEASFGAEVSEVIAKQGSGCADVPLKGVFYCFTVANGKIVPVATTEGITPYASALFTGCGGLKKATLDVNGNGQGIILNVDAVGADASTTRSGSYTFSTAEFTPSVQFDGDSAYLANWYVAANDSQCLLSVMAPLLHSDGTITFNAAIMSIVNGTLQEVVKAGTGVPLPTGSFRLRKDDARGGALVFSSGVVQSGTDWVGVSHVASLNASGTVTPLASSSDTSFLAVAGDVTPNGDILLGGLAPDDYSTIKTQIVPYSLAEKQSRASQRARHK